MRREIFNSDESRIKFDLVFFSYFWWLRSVGNYRHYKSSASNFYGGVNDFHTQFNYGVVPTCMI